MSIELKIKSKYLAEEAKIIRFEEKKLKYQVWWLRTNAPEKGEILLKDANEVHDTRMSLSSHRRWDVRNENRATFLARAYIKQMPYDRIEQKRKLENEYTFRSAIIPKVLGMVNKYGKMNNTTIPATVEDIKKWSGVV